MERDPTSHELLAHFEPMMDAETDDGIPARPPRRVRDARWALKWAAAFATLIIAASTLIEFGYLLAA